MKYRPSLLDTSTWYNKNPLWLKRFDQTDTGPYWLICCPGATLPWVNFIPLGQVHHQLITNLSEFLQFLHKLLQRMNFKHVHLFLVLSGTSCWEIIPTLIMSMRKTTLASGATFAFCPHGEKLPRQGGLPGVVQWVTQLSKLPRGNEKLMWTVTGVRPCPEAKLTRGQWVTQGQWAVQGWCEQALKVVQPGSSTYVEHTICSRWIGNCSEQLFNVEL